MMTKCFDSIIMFRSGKTKVAKEEFYDAKKPVKIRDVNVDNIVISKLIESKNNSEYLIIYLDEVIRPLVLTLPRVSEYIETFKNKGRDKNKNNKFYTYI